MSIKHQICKDIVFGGIIGVGLSIVTERFPRVKESFWRRNDHGWAYIVDASSNHLDISNVLEDDSWL